VLFVQNVGQFAPGARFQARGGPGILWLAGDALWITMLEPLDATPVEPGADLRLMKPAHGVNLRLSFVGADSHPLMEPFGRLETLVCISAAVILPPGARMHLPGVACATESFIRALTWNSAEDDHWIWRAIVHEGADLGTVRLRVVGAERLAVEG
jgi:hypothetical protein